MSPSNSTPSPPPHSLEAERTVLGALLLDSEAIFDIAPLVNPADFFDSVHADVYAAMLKLHQQRTPLDYLVVAEALQSHEKIQQIGGSAFLAELAASVHTSSHAKNYAQIVREKSLRRQLAAAGRDMTTLAHSDDQTASQLLEAAEQKLLQLSRSSTDAKFVQLADLRDERYEHYTAAYESDDPAELFGLTTGFGDLDRLLTGMPAGDLWVIAARPSMGKTALALDVARHVSGAQSKSVVVFSLEMSAQQLADRIFAGALEVSTHQLKRGQISEEQFRQMGQAFDELPGCERLYLEDQVTTIAEIRSRARRHQHDHGLDLIVVDYLQLIDVTDRSAGENQTQRIGFISRSLKRLARELGVPVVALSQLSRACETPHPRPPVLSDLRDSGSIEQDADAVLMLYRESYYHEDCDDPDLTDVYVRKNRQGPTGRVELRFDAQRIEFQSVSRRENMSELVA